MRRQPSRSRPRVGPLVWLALFSAACRSAGIPPPQQVDLSTADREVADLVGQKLEAVRQDPRDAARRLELGMAYEANGFVRAALTTYEQVLELDPAATRGWYLTAVARSRVGDGERALEALARVLELEASYAPAHWRQGEWLLDEGEHDRAEEAFTEATRLAADDAAGWAGLARVQLRRGRSEEAAQILERLLAQHPRDAYLHHLLGTAYRQLGAAEKARQELILGKSARRSWRDPWHEEVGAYRVGFKVSIERAQSMIAAGRYDQAIELLESLREQRSGNLVVLNNLSVALMRSKRIDEALQVLDEAQQLDPDYFPTHLNLAGAYERLGEAERALHYVERAIEINPTLGNAHQRKGVMLLRQRRFEPALESFETALKYEAGNPQLLFFAGMAAGELQRWDLALTRLEQACRFDPQGLRSHLGLAMVAVEAGALDTAQAALVKARAIDPQHPRVQAAEQQLRQAKAAAREGVE